MEPILSTVTNLLPYHLLSYGALLGTELFQVQPQISPTMDPSETQIFPELRQHQSLLSRPPNARVPRPPETNLPRIFQMSGGPRHPYRGNPATAECPIAGLGHSTAGHCGRNRRPELVRLRTEDHDGRGRAEEHAG